MNKILTLKLDQSLSQPKPASASIVHTHRRQPRPPAALYAAVLPATLALLLTTPALVAADSSASATATSATSSPPPIPDRSPASPNHQAADPSPDVAAAAVAAAAAAAAAAGNAKAAASDTTASDTTAAGNANAAANAATSDATTNALNANANAKAAANAAAVAAKAATAAVLAAIAQIPDRDNDGIPDIRDLYPDVPNTLLSNNLLNYTTTPEGLLSWEVIEGATGWSARDGLFSTTSFWSRKQQVAVIAEHPYLRRALDSAHPLVIVASEEYSRIYCGIIPASEESGPETADRYY
ncbi:MAG: hypothetical protein K8963_06095, partial [Proteobacteria bacterium]|nr:hypothetical protein [Pseudomonadota bacterium]